MTLPCVGPIIFEAPDGQRLATATYDKVLPLRPAQILFRGLWYFQNRHDADGWVYRAVGTVPGEGGTDPAVILG